MIKETVIDAYYNGNNTKETETSQESGGPQKDEGHDIEEVYKIIGFGRVQWIVLLVGGLFLLMVINENLGISMLTIASKCDFETDSVDQAVMNSAAILGIAFASYFCGYLSDTLGRRTILLYTTLTANLLSFISMFLPTYWSFVFFRFLVGVFISGASAAVYAYIGEFFSAYYRPIVISYASLFIGVAMAYFPVVCWLILPIDWSIEITDNFTFRAWRLTILFFLLPGLIASIILLYLPETPRFYLSINKPDEAYAAVDWVCRHSKGKSLADFKVYKLKMNTNAHDGSEIENNKSSNFLLKMWLETRPLFQRPHLINFLVCSTVMTGLFMSSTGMGLWYPTIQNRVGLNKDSLNNATVCEYLEDKNSLKKLNNSMEYCDDTVTEKSYIDSTTIGIGYVIGFAVLGAIINSLGPKKILVGSLGLSSIFGVVLLWITKPIAILLSFGIFLILPGLSISVLNSVVVELMPTHLRGKAVCIVLMMGRWGSIFGSNIIGVLIETHCVSTFNFFSGFGIFCAALVFLLPI